MSAKTSPRHRGISGMRSSSLGLLVLLILALIWEALAHWAQFAFGNDLVPTWERMVTTTWSNMSDYWQGGLGLDIKNVSEGGERTWILGTLALLANSLATVGKLISGLILGSLAGLVGGLVVTFTRWARRLIDWPTQILRTFPLLAMVTLFQLWFGTSYLGAVVFVSVAVGAIVFTGTVNAVNNLPALYIDNAQLLGAGKVRLLIDVVLPGVFSELQSAFVLAIGLGWTALIGAELVGSREGLGWIIVSAQDFGQVDKMLLTGLLIMVYAIITTALFEAVSRRVLQWQEK